MTVLSTKGFCTVFELNAQGSVLQQGPQGCGHSLTVGKKTLYNAFRYMVYLLVCPLAGVGFNDFLESLSTQNIV